ncbi:tyrosine-type recombinase/integrase [Streptomyces sp. NPDC085524]|uniref:tyrosine-type recombinase/integrase n=1 Tax=Streptomyces sp. NPDC085524 TaxID=3365728 RepID=UPI0037CDD8CF
MYADNEWFNTLFAALPSNRDRAVIAFWISSGVRASELIGVRQCDVDPGQQLISVVRKGSRARQQVPASADAFVWLRLYQQDLHGLVSRGRTQPVRWTLRRPFFQPLTYHGAHCMLERVNATIGTDWTLHDLRHSAAARMVRDPALTLTDVQWVLGHAHLTTTEIYLALRQDEVVAEGPPRPAGRPTCRAGAAASGTRLRPGSHGRTLRAIFLTITTKLLTRRQLQTANATAEQARARNNVLRELFPPRSAEAQWPATAQSADEVLRRLTSPPFLPAANATRAGRRRGVAKLLRWLSSLPGETWQQRWKTSRAEGIPGAD